MEEGGKNRVELRLTSPSTDFVHFILSLSSKYVEEVVMRAIITLTLVMSLSLVSLANTIHVPSNHSTIQGAIDAALSGDTVVVAPGTYVENIDFKGKAITVKSSGGVDLTVIDGGDPPDPDFGSVVTFNNGEGADSVLEGFKLINGTATDFEFDPGFTRYCGGGILCSSSSPTLVSIIITENWSQHDGGGIYCHYSSPTITDTSIIGNTADEYSGGSGGGIYCDHASPKITDTMIIGNASHSGGGIRCYYSSPTITNTTISENTANSAGGISCCQSSPTITDTTISDNTAEEGEGGGMGCWNNSSPTITNCTIIGNRADQDSNGLKGEGGGIYCSYNNSSPTIANTTITDNVAATEGGGICFERECSPILMNTTITGNTAKRGGGIYCYKISAPPSSIAITNSTISGNTAEEGSGGGIYCYKYAPILTNTIIIGNVAAFSGGGIVCYRSLGNLTNTMITGNTAEDGDGGGIYFFRSWPTLATTTIAGNTAENGNGGGISCYNQSSLTISNTIFWDNAASAGPEIWIGDSVDPSIFSISYSNVKGGHASVYVDPGCTLKWNDCMINEDPLFVDPDHGDFHLSFSSPCINRGTKVGAPMTDIDGDPRPFMGSVDMGADEYVGHHTLQCHVLTFSASQGGDLDLMLDLGSASGNRHYAILGSATGTAPGFALPGGMIFPLYWDGLTDVIYNYFNTSFFQNFLGTLDGSGQAEARFHANSLSPI